MIEDYVVAHYSEGEDTSVQLIDAQSPEDAAEIYRSEHMRVRAEDVLKISKIGGPKWHSFIACVSLEECPPEGEPRT